jgi:halocyanin-like protein
MEGRTDSQGSRRRFLTVAGTVAAVALAGCSGGGGDGGEPTTTGGMTDEGTATPEPTTTGGMPEGETIDGSEYPDVDEWLTTDEVGAPDDTYDGTILNLSGQDMVEVAVGAPGNGGDFAFSPSAIAVDAGTTVSWVWTGNGGAHSVDAEPDEQLDVSDYEFVSGPAVDEAGTEFSFVFNEPGLALYHCEPHLSVGMKGAIVVLAADEMTDGGTPTDGGMTETTS